MIDERWQQAGRVLLIRLDNLGDVLVTTPAIHAVRQALPGAQITLLASPVGAQAGRLNRDIDDVIVYQAPWMDPWHELPHDPERESQVIATLREGAFNGAIIFSSYRQSPLPAAYLCYLAGIPLRAAASIDGPGSLLTTRHRHPDRMLHEVERGLDLVGALGMATDERRLVLTVPDVARTEMTDILMAHGIIHSRPLVILHAGCSMPTRTYPWEMFTVVVDDLVAQTGATVVLTGVEAERELAAQIVARLSLATRGAVHALAGELSFAAFSALIEAADLTITNNTGPMHMSAALQTPVVALFALTNPPEQWGPWLVPHRQLFQDVPCRICYARICPYEHECLTLVHPTRVVEAAVELLGQSQGRLANASRAMSAVPGSAGGDA